MEDVSRDEIVDTNSLITNGIIECLQYFYRSLTDLQNELFNNLNTNDLMECTNEIQEWQENYVEVVSKKVLMNSNYLEILNEETETVDYLQDSMQKEVAKLEKEAELLQRKVAHISKQEENLTDARDEVQTCKLLTKMSFIYKGSNISGCITNSKIDSFELDPGTLTKKYIITTLYDKLKKSSE